jgi:hypothetical protein
VESAGVVNPEPVQIWFALGASVALL